MNFLDLQELLRLELLRRIERGQLTGTRLAQQTGFRQAHISNYLNRKRALSLDGLDRVLQAQAISIDEIIPLPSLAAEAALPSAFDEPPQADPVVEVPIVSSSSVVEEPQILPASVIESIRISVGLMDNRSRTAHKHSTWQRFVATRPDHQQIAAMKPVLAAGCIVVIDRHYTSLPSYRPAGQSESPTLFAVRFGAGLVLRYVEFDDKHLILRALAIDCPTQLIAVAPSETPADYIIGRVCALIHEL